MAADGHREWGARRGRGGRNTGGARPGAGRTPIGAEGRVTVSVSLPRSWVAAARRQARQLSEREGRRVTVAEVYRRALTGEAALGPAVSADDSGVYVAATLSLTRRQDAELRRRARIRGTTASIAQVVREILRRDSEPL